MTKGPSGDDSAQPGTTASITERTSLPIRVAGLSSRRPNRFHLRPDAQGRAAIATELDLLLLRKLSFEGTIEASGPRDWRLEGHLGATVVQPCVVSAEPVTTRLEVPVSRLYCARPAALAPSGPDGEIPDDDRLEPLGTEIDPGAVMTEALALALPDYPRQPEAQLGDEGQLDAAPPGAARIAPERENPFAALAALRGDAAPEDAAQADGDGDGATRPIDAAGKDGKRRPGSDG